MVCRDSDDYGNFRWVETSALSRCWKGAFRSWRVRLLSCTAENASRIPVPRDESRSANHRLLIGGSLPMAQNLDNVDSGVYLFNADEDVGA